MRLFKTVLYSFLILSLGVPALSWADANDAVGSTVRSDAGQNRDQEDTLDLAALLGAGDLVPLSSSSTGACGGYYKAANGRDNICCRKDQRPVCDDDGCYCDYDRRCREACYPNCAADDDC